MQRLMEVRCCCVPKKLLGWLPVPENVYVGEVIRYPCYFKEEDRKFFIGEMPMSRYSSVGLPVAKIIDPWSGKGSYLALKSEETPIEVLRRIPEFKENEE